MFHKDVGNDKDNDKENDVTVVFYKACIFKQYHINILQWTIGQFLWHASLCVQ